MKFSLFFKTPDVLDQITEYWPDPDINQEMLDFARKFIVFNESIVIYFDTEAGTAVARKTN